MKPEERKAKIAQIDERLFQIQEELGQCRAKMEEIAERWRIERSDILREAKVQTGRQQVANLRLHVTARGERTFASPTASWRMVTDRGSKVARAQKTMATRDHYNFTPQDAKNARFTGAIIKRRKDGWQIRDLMAYAHPNEHDAVVRTEEALRPIRIRVTELVAEGTNLAQSKYQHERRLLLPEQSLMTKRVRAKRGGQKKDSTKAGGWANLEGQMELSLTKDDEDKKRKEPAQFRDPTR